MTSQESLFEAGQKSILDKLEEAELKNFLICCSEGTMSRNNQQNLAAEILEILYGDNKRPSKE